MSLQAFLQQFVEPCVMSLHLITFHTHPNDMLEAFLRQFMERASLYRIGGAALLVVAYGFYGFLMDFACIFAFWAMMDQHFFTLCLRILAEMRPRGARVT